ncbi:hypothetical protein RQM59_05475 [Flavobacteriaceae bacterium S356]|uniref:Lipoprotein n=1 Tax=Asprobacillus argus TaxID=3076534 RepID=A0ABU3LDM5_9FLAO|nr:hypothetical protein [Flavobacteriaceae bacterium S356]
MLVGVGLSLTGCNEPDEEYTGTGQVGDCRVYNSQGELILRAM